MYLLLVYKLVCGIYVWRVGVDWIYHLLVRKNMQHVLNLTKTEAKEACGSLSLLEGSRADMVEKIGNALLKNCGVADDGYVLAIDNDDGIDEAIAD